MLGACESILDLLGFQRIDLPAPDLPTDPTAIPYTIENEIGENVVIKQDPNPLPSEIIPQEEPRPITGVLKLPFRRSVKYAFVVYFGGVMQRPHIRILRMSMVNVTHSLKEF